MLPLWYSLKEVIKVPELADGATSKGMLKAGEFYHLLPLTCWRQTGRGKVSQWETLSTPQSFFLKTWRPFIHPNHSLVCVWRSCLLKVAMDSSQCSKSSSKSLVKQEALRDTYPILPLLNCKWYSVWPESDTSTKSCLKLLRTPCPGAQDPDLGLFWSFLLNASCLALKPH